MNVLPPVEDAFLWLARRIAFCSSPKALHNLHWREAGCQVWELLGVGAVLVREHQDLSKARLKGLDLKGLDLKGWTSRAGPQGLDLKGNLKGWT